MARLRLIGQTRVIVTGVDFKIAGRNQWLAQLNIHADNLQTRVADSFAAQRVAGRFELRKNTPKYDAWKAKNSFDPRRGHKTNTLQRTLNTLTLYVVTVGASRAEIRMSEERLRGAVEYAEYYEDAKVRGGEILALAKSWIASEEAKLNAWERRMREQATVKLGKGGKIQKSRAGFGGIAGSIAAEAAAERAALAGAARRRIGGLVGRAVQGFPQAPGAAPIGNDMSFLKGLTKGAQAVIKAARRIK